MRRVSVFLRKTRKGAVRRMVREHYLRSDIGCGCKSCEECSNNPAMKASRQVNNFLQADAKTVSNIKQQWTSTWRAT